MNSEELKRAGEVMIAAGEGRLIECKMKKDKNWYDLGNPNRGQWDFSLFEYRVKPQKKMRPWTPDEVPVGAVVRYKGKSSSVRLLIVSNTPSHWLAHGGIWGYEDLLKSTEHSTDGGKTWHPCGVEVEE